MNASPLESPEQVLFLRSSSMPLVLRPEVLPHTGHAEPGSVVENSPIWSTMSLDVAVE